MSESEHTVAELRTYLRQRRRGRRDSIIPEFEKFIEDVSMIFELRMVAEEYWGGSPRASVFNFSEHRFMARSVARALPLDWEQIRPIVHPDADSPRASLITYIATHCVEETRMIAAGLRKVLSRERVSTPVSKVQQLDTYCMRWLMRQPGRKLEEKAGMRQRIVAVVRRENFDTLENRVFKDFLVRSERLADGFLFENKEKFERHKTYRSVREFKKVCQAALELPEMDLISGINKLPQPNYVLQQDNRYSKIWKLYCRIVKLANLSEKLWNRRDEIVQKLVNLCCESDWQHENSAHAKYCSQVWFNPLAGDVEFLEWAKTSHDFASAVELLRRSEVEARVPADSGCGVVDLSCRRAWGSSLIIGGYHENARPRIYHDEYPLFDDAVAISRKVARRIELQDIFLRVNEVSVQDGKGNDYSECMELAECYCARLFGEYSTRFANISELVVLSPDDWNAVTQEVVIRSFSMLERSKVHLLWRSVAAVLPAEKEISKCIDDGDSVAEIDFRLDGNALITSLKYLRDTESGRLVPQRGVYFKNGSVNASRYEMISRPSDATGIMSSELVKRAKVLVLSGDVPDGFWDGLRHSYFLSDRGTSGICNVYEAERGGSRWTLIGDSPRSWGQRDGSLLFCREHGKRTLYFDELEPMYVVGQDEIHEKVISVKIVDEDERFKGGTTREIRVPSGLMNIGAGQRGVEFLFHMGQISDTTPLHRYKQDLVGEFVRRSVPLEAKIRVSPGQGMALTQVSASIFKEPIMLDYLKNMEQSEETIAKKNDEIVRSFPPTSAVVEAYQNSGVLTFWGNALSDIDYKIQRFAKGELSFDEIPPELFYRARRKRPEDLRRGESKLQLLDRFNIFGNVSYALRPSWMTEAVEKDLIKKVAAGGKRNQAKALKLLAWTYRGDNPIVADLTRRVFRLWVAGRTPGYSGGMTLWRSLMANMLSCRSLRDLLPKFVDEFIKRGNRGTLNGDDMRLFYNIVQFDEDFSVHSNLTCEKGSSIALALCRAIENYRVNGRPHNYGSALRCLLYLLRLREKERYFLRDYSKFVGEVPVSDSTYDRMVKAFDGLNRELDCRFPNEGPDTKLLRTTVRKFLNGSGTLPDLLAVQEGD